MIDEQHTFSFPIISKTNIYPTRKRFDTLGNWTKEEDELLHRLIAGNSINVCNENNQNKKKQWHQIASYFNNKSPQQIMNHWNKVINPTLIKGNWSREEDELLIKWVKENGERGWTKIAAQLPGRIGKQCRERWINCLNPKVRKTEWTIEEDNSIISMHEQFGNKWSKMAELLPGRSDNQIKNRWNSTLKKRILNLKPDKKIELKAQTETDIDFFDLNLYQTENKANDDIFGGGPWFNCNELEDSNSIFSTSCDSSFISNDDSWMEKER